MRGAQRLNRRDTRNDLDLRDAIEPARDAQAGIVALSLATSPAMKEGKHWEIPADMHAPIQQAAIVLKSAKHKKTAEALLEFVKTEAGRATLAKYGFSFPSRDSKVTP